MSREILEILPQKRRKDRFNILDEEGFMLSLSAETIARHHIRPGMVLGEELLETLRAEDTVCYAKELSAAYLAYAPRTKAQLRKHLLAKGIDPVSAETAIGSMEEYGYIDDGAYAEEFAKSASKKMGAAAIRAKLLEKGVSREIVEERAAPSPEEQREAAAVLIAKLRQKLADLPEHTRRRRIYGTLMRRGFLYEDVKDLLGEEE